MSEFILHCFAESGNAYKVALLMEVSGLKWTRWCPHACGNHVLDDLGARGLKAPVLAIIDGHPGLRRAVERVWPPAAV
jgi:hypothetical protein